MNKCGFNFVDLVFEWFYKINVVKIQKKIPRRDIPATLSYYYYFIYDRVSIIIM